MEYIGHTDGERVQLLQNHLDGTAELAGRFAAALGLELLGKTLGKNHDLGKYSSLFQEYIRGQKSAVGITLLPAPATSGTTAKRQDRLH